VPSSEPWIEPNLGAALVSLSVAQRTAVVLVHGFGWTMKEVANCTGIRVTTVQNHLDRGLRKLRAELKVVSDVTTR
jgi:DNA-directed RNA polymerase specialized sigma24 family protein